MKASVIRIRQTGMVDDTDHPAGLEQRLHLAQQFQGTARVAVVIVMQYLDNHHRIQAGGCDPDIVNALHQMGDVAELAPLDFHFQGFALGNLLSVLLEAQSPWGVLGEYPSFGAHSLGQNEGVVAAGRIHVQNRHAGIDSEKLQHLHRFARVVADIIRHFPVRAAEGFAQGFLVQRRSARTRHHGSHQQSNTTSRPKLHNVSPG